MSSHTRTSPNHQHQLRLRLVLGGSLLGLVLALQGVAWLHLTL
jgi:hypothetical protein